MLKTVGGGRAEVNFYRVYLRVRYWKCKQCDPAVIYDIPPPVLLAIKVLLKLLGGNREEDCRLGRVIYLNKVPRLQHKKLTLIEQGQY